MKNLQEIIKKNEDWYYKEYRGKEHHCIQEQAMIKAALGALNSLCITYEELKEIFKIKNKQEVVLKIMELQNKKKDDFLTGIDVSLVNITLNKE